MATDEWIECPKCGTRLKESNLDDHMGEVHPRGATSEEERQRIQRREKWVDWGKKGAIAVAAFLVVFGGFALASQMGILGTGGSGAAIGCENVEDQRGATIHEHAGWKLYLNSTQPYVPYDFTQQKYQVAASYVHIEGGEANPIHIHEERPSLGCFLDTLGWEVQQDPLQMTSDTGQVYADDANHDLEILVDGEPAEDGWATPLLGVSDADQARANDKYVIRWTYTGGNTAS